MKWAVGNRLSGSTSKTGEIYLITSEALVENNRVSSNIYFVRSRKHLIHTNDARQFAAKEITVIYLSFTNARISITLPGGGVSLEGGTNRPRNRK
jgi:hypothetical protein